MLGHCCGNRVANCLSLPKSSPMRHAEYSDSWQGTKHVALSPSKIRSRPHLRKASHWYSSNLCSAASMHCWICLSAFVTLTFLAPLASHLHREKLFVVSYPTPALGMQEECGRWPPFPSWVYAWLQRQPGHKGEHFFFCSQAATDL